MIKRIQVEVELLNPLDKEKRLTCRPFVEPGVAGLLLPMAWKDQLGQFSEEEEVRLVSKDNKVIAGEVCGPVGIKINSARRIFNEIIFVDMKKSLTGEYEPLLGHILLEQAQLAIDIPGGKLVPLYQK